MCSWTDTRLTVGTLTGLPQPLAKPLPPAGGHSDKHILPSSPWRQATHHSAQTGMAGTQAGLA